MSVRSTMKGSWPATARNLPRAIQHTPVDAQQPDSPLPHGRQHFVTQLIAHRDRVLRYRPQTIGHDDQQLAVGAQRRGGHPCEPLRDDLAPVPLPPPADALLDHRHCAPPLIRPVDFELGRIQAVGASAREEAGLDPARPAADKGLVKLRCSGRFEAVPQAIDVTRRVRTPVTLPSEALPDFPCRAPQRLTRQAVGRVSQRAQMLLLSIQQPGSINWEYSSAHRLCGALPL
jgi:hypothetical protein